jgi:hypothetical protein
MKIESEICGENSNETRNMESLFDLSFNVFALSEMDLFVCVFAVFDRFDLFQKLNISKFSLFRFVTELSNFSKFKLSVDSLQFAAWVVINSDLESLFNEGELLALFTSCLVTDLATDIEETDLRLTLSLQKAIAVINQEGIDLFSHLTAAQCRGVWQIIVTCVLNLNMRNHFGIIEGYIDNKSENGRRILFLSVLLKTAKLGLVARQFEIGMDLVLCLAKDFYRDGDLDRAVGMVYVHNIELREKLDEVRSVIGFVKSVCVPLFEAIAMFHPSFQSAVDQLNWNLRRLIRDCV